MAATNRNFWRLIDILNQAGWEYKYMVSSGRGKDACTTYYLAPYYTDPEAISIDAMIDELTSTFGAYNTYIYRLQDVNNIWSSYAPVLEITLLNK